MSAILTFLIQNPIIAAVLLVVVIVLFIALLVSKSKVNVKLGPLQIGAEDDNNEQESNEDIDMKQFEEKLSLLDKRISILETQNKNTDVMLADIKAAVVRVETFLMHQR